MKIGGEKDIQRSWDTLYSKSLGTFLRSIVIYSLE